MNNYITSNSETASKSRKSPSSWRRFSWRCVDDDNKKKERQIATENLRKKRTPRRGTESRCSYAMTIIYIPTRTRTRRVMQRDLRRAARELRLAYLRSRSRATTAQPYAYSHRDEILSAVRRCQFFSPTCAPVSIGKYRR